MKKIKLQIKGMHCASCEILLEKEFKKVPGLKSCKVNHKKGYAEIVCEDKVPLSKFKDIVRESGYSLEEDADAKNSSTSDSTKKTASDYAQIILIAVGMGILFFILSDLELGRYLPNFGEQMNVMIALLMGIVASLSTCLALTGGIVMSFGSLVQINENTKHHFLARAKPHLYFHLGRIGGFAILGGILGLIGSKINYSLGFTGYLTILIAIVMFYIGLQILGFVPNITKLGFHLPKGLSNKIHTLENNKHPLMPTIIGVLTFFLPCGFTQTMQLAAVTSQSAITGALIMGAFAIGTLPVLLSIGIGSTYAHKDKWQLVNHFIGVLIVFFSLYSFNSGLVLAGSPITIDVWNTGTEATTSEVSDDIQVVKMDIDWTYKPDKFVIKKGVPVHWEINGINVSGCSNQIVIPSMNISKKINQGLNVVEFTPEKAGTLPFSCWMGMINGQFIVEE